MEKMLYYVRHGQTVFNLRRKMQGWSDSPLTELGERQAAWVRDYFIEKGIDFDHAYCSTSERCCDTLEIITKMPYTRTKKLKEMCYGLLEGESLDLSALGDRKREEVYYLQFGGSSSLDVRDRMVNFITEILEIEDHKNVLVVSHGACGYYFLSGLNLPKDKMPERLTNACVIVLGFENGKYDLKEIVENPVVE